MDARPRLGLPLPLPLVLLALGLAASAAPGRACTTFCLRDSGRVILGKNYDWNVGDGMLVVNQRGLERTADLGSSPARWTSRYGSVTFDQYGRDFPSGGMNEAGLAIELMWLGGSRYPAQDGRPALDVLQWIQYQLDTHATVDQVLASDREIRIESATPLHYIVADRTGRVATVEFLDGRLVAHAGESLPFAALTNDTYDESLRFARGLSGRPVPPGEGSLERFARAAERARAWKASRKDAVGYAFATLDQVAQAASTQWSIVYELDRLAVHYRTRGHREIKTLSLEGLDFNCGAPVRVLDLAAPVSGDVSRRLVPYTREINRALVAASYRKTPFLATTPAAELDRLARVPERAACRMGAGR